MDGRPQRAAHPRRPAPPEVCAETHCAVLVQKGTVFENCHATVDPKPFYKVGGGVGMEGPQGRLSGFERTLMATVCPQRCVYQACNYEETFPHICAALGDYALACASRGVLLQGWRNSVDNCSAWGDGACVAGTAEWAGPVGHSGVGGAGGAQRMGGACVVDTAGGRGLRGRYRGRLPRI